MSTKIKKATTPEEINVIDQFNTFWIANRKTIYATLIILIIAVGSFVVIRQQKLQAKAEAKNAFQMALATNLNNPSALLMAMQQVADEYATSEYGAYASFLIANQNLNENNPEAALPWFDKALNGTTKGTFVYAETIEGRGVTLEALGRNDEAMKEYIKVLALKEGAHRYPAVSLKLALLYKTIGNNEAAVKQFKTTTTFENTPVEIKALAEKEIAILQ